MSESIVMEFRSRILTGVLHLSETNLFIALKRLLFSFLEILRREMNCIADDFGTKNFNESLLSGKRIIVTIFLFKI